MFQFGNSDYNMLVSSKKLNKYYSDEMLLDINNPNDSHSIIAKSIKENSYCLDVGCGVGYIGELLKKHRNSKVDGIEIDEESIKILKDKKCYDNIYNIYIEPGSVKYKQFMSNDKKYNYIIFADVIEHLVDVGQIIFDFSKKLAKNGKMLVSIPNIAHFDVIKNLSGGKFNYNTTGILDNTHLRFFTKNSFIEMIDAINKIYGAKLYVKVIGKTIVETSYLENYPNIYSIFNMEDEGCVVQYIYEIEINEKKSKNLNIIYSTNHLDDIEKKFIELNNTNKENVSRLNNIIEELEKKLDEDNIKLLELTNELDKKNNSIEELNKIRSNYLNVINSKSWKLTAIFRKISSLIRKRVG